MSLQRIQLELESSRYAVQRGQERQLLHLFSRNEVMKTMVEQDATVQELMAATGNKLVSVQPYIEGANLDKQRKSGNAIRQKKFSKLGLLLNESGDIITADADLEYLLNVLQQDADRELSAATGVNSIAHEPALYQCKRDADGNITSKQVWRRERDLNSRGSGPLDFQSSAIPGYAISATLIPPALPV